MLRMKRAMSALSAMGKVHLDRLVVVAGASSVRRSGVAARAGARDGGVEMFEIRKVDPIGTRTFRALVKPRSGPCTFQDVTEPTYPESPGGDNLYRTRVASMCSVSTLAKRLGMSAPNLSAVEHGRAVFVDIDDWDRALDAARRTPSAPPGEKP